MVRSSRQYQGLNDDVGLKWQNFMVTLDTVKLKFENTLIRGLTKLETSGALDRIVTSFGKLANGMRFVVRRNATPQGTALVRMEVAAGSLEPDLVGEAMLVVDTGCTMAGLATTTSAKRDVAVLTAGVIGQIAMNHGRIGTPAALAPHHGRHRANVGLETGHQHALPQKG